MNLGEFIRERRMGELLTIKEAARLTGVSASHISRIERGERHPSTAVMNRLAAVIPLEGIPDVEFGNQPFELERLRTLQLEYMGKPASIAIRDEIIQILDRNNPAK